jgi:hypothetical protein
VDGVVPMDDGVHMAGQVGQDNCVVWPVGPAEVLMLAGSRDHEELRSVALAVQSASRP